MIRKRVLITGGAGYIGSHAVVAFEQAGYETVILDNLSNSSRTALDGIRNILGYDPEFHEGNVGDCERVRSIISDREFAGSIHFAGLKAVGESTQKPFLYFENNVSESFQLLRMLEEHGIRNIVFSSSATVYSGTNPMPLTEASRLGTTNPYGTSKLILEQTFEDLCRHSGWNVIALRYFNPIGAHPS